LHNTLVVGLDKISNGFQTIVGNSARGGSGAGVIFSAGVIFISEFTLYFGIRKNPKTRNGRVLAWFFSHFFYLSAVVVTLQGKVALASWLPDR
jgi:hypothetical protein